VGVITFPYRVEQCKMYCMDAHELHVFDVDDLGDPSDVFTVNQKGWIYPLPVIEESVAQPLVLDRTLRIRGICERCYDKNGESPEYVFDIKVAGGVISSCEEVRSEEPGISE